MATPVAINLIFINAFVVNVSWGRGEASEGRESLIMNRSPTLAVRRCNGYALIRDEDHYLLLGRQRSFLRAFGVSRCL